MERMKERSERRKKNCPTCFSQVGPRSHLLSSFKGVVMATVAGSWSWAAVAWYPSGCRCNFWLDGSQRRQRKLMVNLDLVVWSTLGWWWMVVRRSWSDQQKHRGLSQRNEPQSPNLLVLLIQAVWGPFSLMLISDILLLGFFQEGQGLFSIFQVLESVFQCVNIPQNFHRSVKTSQKLIFNHYKLITTLILKPEKSHFP